MEYMFITVRSVQISKKIKGMMTKRDTNISEAARAYSDNRDNRMSFICGARWADNHPNAVDFWHKQSEEDIDDSIIGWSKHSFICLMKDGTTQEFTGIQDESYDGSISKHLDCVDDNYEWEYDDITYWIEVPNIKAHKGE